MIKRLAFFATMLSLASCAHTKTPSDTKFNLEGKIEGAQGKKIVQLMYFDEGQRIFLADTIDDGVFHFEGKVTSPLKGNLRVNNLDPETGRIMMTIGGAGMTQLYLENTAINVSFKEGDIKNAVITGGPVQTEFNEYNKFIEEPASKQQELMDKLYAGYRNKNLKPEEFQALQAEIGTQVEKITDLSVKYVNEHKDSYVSVGLLDEITRREGRPVEDLFAMFNSMSESVKNSSVGQKLNQSLTYLKASQIGNIAPDFTKKSITGEDLTLSSLRGKYVLLDFWGSWCGPCRASHPHLREINEKYKSHDLEIVSIGCEKNRNLEKCESSWKKAVEKDGMQDWKHVLNNYDTDKFDIPSMFSVKAYPTKILLDKEGKIVAKHIGGGNNEQLDQKLKDLIGL